MRYVLVEKDTFKVVNSIEIDPVIQDSDQAYVPPAGFIILKHETANIGDILGE